MREVPGGTDVTMHTALATYREAYEARANAVAAVRQAEEQVARATRGLQEARIPLCEAATGAGQEVALLVPWNYLGWDEHERAWRVVSRVQIRDAAEEFVLLAQILGEPVPFRIGGVRVLVAPSSTPHSVEVDFWNEQRAAARRLFQAEMRRCADALDDEHQPERRQTP